MAVNIGNLVAEEIEIKLSYISIPALKGDKGDTGRGISSVVKTSTVGLVDTWTITYTDGSTSIFQVTNGADGDDYVITESDYEEIADIVLDNIEIPTKVSDLDNDSGFIDKDVDDLTNYYTKSETYNKTEVDNKISSVYKYKGSVATYADLPSTSLTIGDVYNVESTGDNYAWTGTTWDKLGGEIDLSEYYTKTQVDSALENKVDKVTGKGLSTNDFTNADKTKLNSLENYDDTEVKSDIETLDQSQAIQDEKIAKLKADHPPIEEEGTDLSINGTGDFDLSLSPKGNITQAILPEAYQQVEYIESSGGQYIDTGVKGNNNTRADISFRTKTVGNSQAVFGYYVGGYNKTLFLYSSGDKHFQVGYGAFQNLSDRWVDNTKYEISLSNGKIIINGTETTITEASDFTTDENLLLFKISGSTGGGMPIQLYNFKIYNGDTLVRNFIPCYKISNNEIGLYDIVNNVFYTNAGTGTFTKGADAPTPNAEIPVKVVDGSYDLLLQNKNLFDGTFETGGYSIFTGEKEFAADRIRTVGYMKIKPSKTYSMSYENPGSVYVLMYDENKTFLSYAQVMYRTTNGTFATSSDTEYITFYYIPYNHTVSIDEICQIEYGSTATSYVTHQQQTKTIDTSPNPLYSANDLYFKAVNGDSFYDSLTSEQKANLDYGYWYVYNEFNNQDFTSGVSSVTINDMKSNGQFYSTVGGTVSGTTITFSGTTTGSGNIVYELATPTNTKITNTTLITQLEALLTLTAYQDQTNISQTHNTAQADMKINAKTIMSLRYMQSEIENLSSRLALLE